MRRDRNLWDILQKVTLHRKNNAQQSKGKCWEVTFELLESQHCLLKTGIGGTSQYSVRHHTARTSLIFNFGDSLDIMAYCDKRPVDNQGLSPSQQDNCDHLEEHLLLDNSIEKNLLETYVTYLSIFWHFLAQFGSEKEIVWWPRNKTS